MLRCIGIILLCNEYALTHDVKLQIMQILEKRKGTSYNEQFLLEHGCPTMNHEKSSGSMESVGVIQIFN